MYDATNRADRAAKKRALIDMRIRLANVSARQSEGDDMHPRWRSAGEPHRPFPLTDLQAAHFVAKHMPEADPVGCQMYLEFLVRDLDIDRLESAWRRLVAFHPMLRARIDRDGTQCVPSDVPTFSIRRYEVAAGEALNRHINAIRAEMSHKLYPPGAWPLFDIRVTQSPELASRVHVSMDSWIVDGASADLVYRQWRLLYDSSGAAVLGAEATFRDFVLSMKAFEGSEGHKRCATYWNDKLRAMPDAVRLPYRPREAGHPHNPRRRRLQWVYPRGDWDHIQRTLRGAELSPNTAVLGIFVEQLRVLHGSEPFPLIVSHHNRPRMHADIDQIVGPFSSTSIFIADDRPGTSFADGLRQHQRQLWRDVDNGHVSGVAALRDTTSARPGQQIPVVFTSSLGFAQAVEPSPSWLDDVDYVVSQTPGIDLQFYAYERADGLHLAWDVADDRFEPGVIDALFERTCLGVSVLGTAGLIPGERSLADRIDAQLRRAALASAGADGGEDIPMTPLQQAYLTQGFVHPDAAPAAIYREFDIPAFDLGRLQLALTAVIEGSDVLRSLASAEKAKFLVFGDSYYPIPLDDLTGLDPGEVEAKLQTSRSVIEAAWRGSRTWPPFDLRAVRLDVNTTRLQVLLDPIVFDGHGTWQFYQELFRRYVEGDRAVLRPQLTYGDYARARERYRKTNAFAGDQQYWAAKFEHLPPGPRWPWPMKGGAAAPQRYTIVFEHWQLLKDAAAARNVSPIAVLLSLYSEVLHRWSRCDSLAVLAVDYRQRSLMPDFAQTYGDFSTLAWVPSESRSPLPLAERVRAVADVLARDGRHDWGNPFEVLRRICGDSENRPAYPATMTNCLGAQTRRVADIVEVRAASTTPGSDIDVMVIETERGLGLFWEICHERVPCAVATAMTNDYRDMLVDLAADDMAWQRPIGSLGLRRAGRVQRQAQGLSDLNQTDAEYGREQCLHRLFEIQAVRQPERVALISDDGSLTYGELERRANRLARFLQRRGVGRGARVAVLLSPSSATVVSLLAILKAGAAYVPLSVTDPVKRVAALLESVEARATVTTLAHAVLLEDASSAVVLDRDGALIEAEDGATPPAVDIRAEDTAYIIFTSGSTSEPKGVVVCHRPVINLIEWAQKRFHFGVDDRVLFVNSLGFDLSVFDIFALLAYGGSIRVAAAEQRTEPMRLARILLHEQITFWNSAPAYLQFVMPSLKPLARTPHDCKLRLVFLSGDRIDPSLPAELRDTIPGAQVVALGGATEATVWSNYFPIADIAPAWTSVPYGKPIQNARYYILDDQLEPCPVGVCGRLYIGGDCLSSGYLNAPELTRSRFLSDPFHDRPGMTMFDSGDLARLMNDGNIELIGRADDQVKIRGFRIGLPEIEAALARCGLASPVAVVREETPGNRQIAAFGIMNATEGRVHDPKFWQRLRDELPEHMLPALVYALPLLPMTANGKLDRQGLARRPLPDADRTVVDVTGSRVAGRAPPGADTTQPQAYAIEPLTRFLCSTLADILSLPGDAVDANLHFSTFGVSSLQFSVLSARIAEASGTTISPAKLFHCTSVDSIVETLSQTFPEALTAFATRQPEGAVSIQSSKKALVPSSFPTGRVALKANPAPVAPREFAIIGIHCLMPQADGPDAFWANLAQGRDCIELIPPMRWDWQALCGDSRYEANVTRVNKAGFIRAVDRFDAAFFNISPREAELMDPRQRLLLEGTWKTIENAGYRPSDLSEQPIGVFIGATGDEYSALLQQIDHAIDQFSLTGGGRSFLANRLSYHFGWHGPSEVVDTTCSSSLVAVHNAVRAIESGDCSMAIVGGINIMIDPRPHLSLAKIGVLSTDGACKTFDAGANGYVRGEGLGLMLIKPLQQAEADHDHVYAIISGTAINHGGRANSMTAPNHRAQARVIIEAVRSSAIEPRQIGYIEAHGTGTRLGDPIEIEGIKEAFATIYADRSESFARARPISVGAIKPNVGHLEAAAGIAGVMKVVLMLRHRLLPPLIHLKTPNPEIDLHGTPFCFETTASEWTCPLDDRGDSLPRAAGISAFGIGGVNAHVVLREYVSEHSDTGGAAAPVVIPLAARSKAQLAEYAGLLRDALQAGKAHLSLADVAFTLAVGREPFDERAAIVTRSLDALVDQLDEIAAGNQPHDCWCGSVQARAKRASSQGPVDEQSEPTHLLTAPELAAAWVAGHVVDWGLVHSESQRRRVPLPGHPFAGISYWVAALRPRTAAPLPLLLTNVGNGTDPGYAICLSGEEPFIKDHLIDGVRVVPASAYIAFAALVAKQVYGDGPVRMKALTWTRALRFTNGTPMRLRLAVKERGDTHVLSFRDEESEKQIEYASVAIELVGAQRDTSRIEIAALQRRCTDRYSAPTVYERLAECGMKFGPSLRVVRTLWCTDREALAHVMLPSDVGEVDHPIHPAILDGALQTVLLHHIFSEHRGLPIHMPFSLREVVAHAALSPDCYVHAVLTRANIGPKALREYDVSLLALDGRLLVRFSQYTGAPVGHAAAKPHGDLQLFREQWSAVTATGRGHALDPARTYHVTIGLPTLADALHRGGQRVLASALLPAAGDDWPAGHGSAIPWGGLLEDVAFDAHATIVLWYDHSRISRLQTNQQLRFGFDSLFDLVKQLLVMRQLKHCQIVMNLISASATDHNPTLEALSGFARVVQQESPHLRVMIAQCTGLGGDAAPSECAPLLRAVEAILSNAGCIEHRIDLGSKRHLVRRLQLEPEIARTQTLPVAAGSTCVITGGMGAIGRLLAGVLLERGGKVALLGRTPFDTHADAFKAIGGDANVLRYYQADVTDRAALDRSLTRVREQLGPIRAIVHCAGQARAGLLRLKNLDVAREVLSAKVFGTVHLDEATRDDPIDSFVLFSSLASVTGPVGAADYAYASRYLDLFAVYRNALARRGQRQGRTVAVSWPLWSGGGLHLVRQDLDYLRARGLESIDGVSAVQALAACLAGGAEHYLCAYGDSTKFKDFLGAAYPAPVGAPRTPPHSDGTSSFKPSLAGLVQA